MTLAATLRRTALAAALIGSAAFVGCVPQPSPLTTPTFGSATQLPSIVTAGESFDITVTITSHGAVTAANLAYFTRILTGGATQFGDIESFLDCTPATKTVAAGITTVHITCQVATDAPNGHWNYLLLVDQANHLSGNVQPGGLTIVGGSDDYDPPVVTVITPPPASVARGATFSMTLQATDASPPIRQPGAQFHEAILEGFDVFSCSSVVTDIGADAVESTLTCDVPATIEAANYRGAVGFFDHYSQGDGIEYTIVVT